MITVHQIALSNKSPSNNFTSNLKQNFCRSFGYQNDTASEAHSYLDKTLQENWS